MNTQMFGMQADIWNKSMRDLGSKDDPITEISNQSMLYLKYHRWIRYVTDRIVRGIQFGVSDVYNSHH